MPRSNAKGTRRCIIEGCGDTVHARWMCPKHYQRWLRHENPNHSPAQCLIDGCLNGIYGRSLCAKHYQQMKRNPTTVFLSTCPNCSATHITQTP